jgi:hypothetical protein
MISLRLRQSLLHRPGRGVLLPAVWGCTHANIDPERRFPSMFEPLHGSAFDYRQEHR